MLKQGNYVVRQLVLIGRLIKVEQHSLFYNQGSKLYPRVDLGQGFAQCSSKIRHPI